MTNSPTNRSNPWAAAMKIPVTSMHKYNSRESGPDHDNKSPNMSAIEPRGGHAWHEIIYYPPLIEPPMHNVVFTPYYASTDQLLSLYFDRDMRSSFVSWNQDSRSRSVHTSVHTCLRNSKEIVLCVEPSTDTHNEARGIVNTMELEIYKVSLN